MSETDPIRPEDVSSRPIELEAGLSAVTAALVAVANPIAGVVVAGTAAWGNSRATRRWRETLERRLDEVDRRIDFTDEATVAVLSKLSIAALQTARTEKLEILANAMANTTVSDANPDLLQEQPADLAVVLSPEHIEVLRLLADPAGTVRRYSRPPSTMDSPIHEFVDRVILNGLDEPTLVSEGL